MADRTFWKNFASCYVKDSTYWFFPKASTVDSLEFKKKFEVFNSFEGKIWDGEVQSLILSRLKKKGLSDAGSAYPRMLKRVFEVMALCSIESDSPIKITKIGKQFLNEDGLGDVLDKAIWRYQLPNPVNSSDATRGIKIHPHAFLLNVMLRTGLEISSDEYCLFISRAKSHSDLEKTVEIIISWRKLSVAEKIDVKARLRSPIYTTVLQNRSYAFAFHNCDKNIIKAPGSLKIGAGSLKKTTDRLDRFTNRAPLYYFKTEQDYINFLSITPEDKTPEEELDYYVDISDVENATKAFSNLPDDFKKGKTEEEFKREQLLEKDLEDFLEKNMHLIEPGLKFKKRQYQTPTGPLDLLGIASNGDLVVVELKKDRASDRVFGQISRYIGGLMEDKAYKKFNVRGYIICREIDHKLSLASKVSRENTLSLRIFSAIITDGRISWVKIS